MVYVCSICGHVYDEAKEKVPFAQLPDDWTCPSCGAEKAMFDPVTDDDAGQEKVVEAEAHKLEKLPPAILATIFSNFERACRKQYDEEGAKLFHELSLALAPAAGKGTPDDLAAMVDEDISKLYPALKSLCAGKKDRGALRADLGREGHTHPPLAPCAAEEAGHSLRCRHFRLAVHGMRLRLHR